MPSSSDQSSHSDLLASNNHLFALARLGKRLPPWYIAVLVTLVINIVVPILLSAIDLSGALSTSTDIRLAALVFLITTVIVYGVRILLIALWVKAVERRPFWTIGLERSKAFSKYLLGALLGLVMYGLVTGITLITGAATPITDNPARVGVGALAGVLIVLPAFIVQGASEEVSYRGWLAFTQGARYRPWVGLLMTSLLFAIGHLPALLAGGFNPIGILSIFAFSIFATLYALYTKSLWGICGLHATWNWAEGNIFGTQVSGHDFTTSGTLIKLSVQGPDWLTGGSFGPEGGLPVLLVLLIGIAIILFMARRHSPERVATPQSNG